MKMSTPDIKLDSISLNAKPKAKPVSPKPATIADILTPRVPKAVINPTMSMIFFTIPASTREILAWELFLSIILRTMVLNIVPLTQKRMNIPMASTMLGAFIDIVDNISLISMKIKAN